jgi:hypothetical protein
MIANLEPFNTISRQVETAAVGFGKALKKGTGDRQVQAATAAVDIVMGISVRDQSVALPTSGTGDQYSVLDDALVLQRGVIWVTAGATVTVGAQVYMVVGTGQAGNFTTISASNLLIPGAFFESSGVVGDLVKIRIR